MKEKLEEIKAEALSKILQAKSLDDLNDVRVNQLGKKGALTGILKSMKDVAPEDRPKVGQLVNEARVEILSVEPLSTSTISKSVFCLASSSLFIQFSRYLIPL